MEHVALLAGEAGKQLTPTGQVEEALRLVDQGTVVSHKVLDLLSRMRGMLRGMDSAHTLIINQDPNPTRKVQFYVYNTFAPIKWTTQFNFASSRGIINEVYCPAMGTGWKGMKVYVDNEDPGWGITRGGVYVYDGQTFNPILDKATLLEKTEKVDDLKQKALNTLHEKSTNAVPAGTVPKKDTKQVNSQSEQSVATNSVDHSDKSAFKPQGELLAQIEYDDYYKADDFGSQDMAPYVQPVANEYDQHDYVSKLSYQTPESYGVEWMNTELLLAGMLGIVLLVICATFVFTVGAVLGVAVRYLTLRNGRKDKGYEYEQCSDQEEQEEV